MRDDRGLRRVIAGSLLLAAVVVLLPLGSIWAQGQPKAAAPAERKSAEPGVKLHLTNDPDISGIWTHHPAPAARAYANCCFADPKMVNPLMSEWGLARFKQNKPGFGPDAVKIGMNDPTVQCNPPGVPRIYMHLFPMQIIQIPGMVLETFEYDHFIRRIYTDGRPHPADLEPSWMGHSIGHWEGDTLVVDTVGFNDKTWIDRDGHPHSEKLHVIERIRRPERGTLVVGITIEDPVAYKQTFSGEMRYEYRPDWHIEEHICEDNVNDSDLEK